MSGRLVDSGSAWCEVIQDVSGALALRFTLPSRIAGRLVVGEQYTVTSIEVAKRSAQRDSDRVTLTTAVA